MAQEKIPQPAEDAFKGGALDRKYLGRIVDVINTPMEIKGGGKVIYSKEKIVFDLTGMQDGKQTYIAMNGAIRLALIPIRVLQ